MFRVKITGYKKGNISIGILIILSIVLLNLVIVITSVLNMYRGARAFEINSYKDARGVIEESIKIDKIENAILSKINEFAKDIKKDKESLNDAFTKFVDIPFESEEKYYLAYDKVFNEFFLYSKESNKRKNFIYFINDGKIGLKFKKV